MGKVLVKNPVPLFNAQSAGDDLITPRTMLPLCHLHFQGTGFVQVMENLESHGI